MQTSATPQTTTQCYHCGEPLGARPITQGDYRFCCSGCQTVFNVLDASGLCAYYDYEIAPGTTHARSADKLPELAYLDDPTLAHQLVDYLDEAIGVVTFRVPGMHCSSCLWLLEQLHRLDAGILASEVQLGQKTVRIRYNPAAISLRGVVTWLFRIGYPPVLEAKTDAAPQKQRSRAERRLISQIGLAGFSLGNIMLLAFPDYLSPGTVASELQLAFTLVSIALAGLALFAGRDYWIRAWQGLRLKRFAIEQPLVLGMAAMLGLSLAEVAATGRPGYLDSLAGLVFFLLVGKWLQQRTFDRLQFDRDFRSLFPLGVTVVEDDGTEEVRSLNSIVPGERLVLRSGELVPVDAHLLSSDARFDYSFLTGEATPVLRTQGTLLYAGGRVLSGRTEVLSASKASNSRLAQLWEQPRNTQQATHAKATDYTVAVNRLGGYFTAAVLLLALGTLVYWLRVDTATGWLAAAGLLVIACPCALAFAPPFALGTLQAWLGKQGLFLRQSAVVEALGRATDIVFDKTGTLTDPDSTHATYTVVHTALTEAERAAATALAQQSVHPLSQSVAKAFAGGGSVSSSVSPVVEGFMEKPGQGIAATVGGIAYKLGRQAFVADCKCGMKCKAFKQNDGENAGETRVHLSIDGRYRGYFSLSAAYLPGMPTLLDTLSGMGYHLHLLSGDTSGEAAHLSPFFGNGQVHFEQSPEDKLRYIQQLQAAGKRVAFLGDGLNDAAALQQADAGIAVTGDTALFTPASDGISLRSTVLRLPEVLRLSRQTLQAIRTTFAVSLLYNAIGAAIAVQGLLAPVVAAVLMPLISISSMLLATGLVRWAIARNSKQPSVKNTTEPSVASTQPALAA